MWRSIDISKMNNHKKESVSISFNQWLKSTHIVKFCDAKLSSKRMKIFCMVVFCVSFIAYMAGAERVASVPSMIVMLVLARWFQQEERWEKFWLVHPVNPSHRKDRSPVGSN